MKTASRCCANLGTWLSPTSSVNSSKAKTMSCSSCVSSAYAQPCLPDANDEGKQASPCPTPGTSVTVTTAASNAGSSCQTALPSLPFLQSFLQSCRTSLDSITFIQQSRVHHLVFCGVLLAKSLHFCGSVTYKMGAIIADTSTGQGTPRSECKGSKEATRQKHKGGAEITFRPSF